MPWMSKVSLSLECLTTCTRWPLRLISPSLLSKSDISTRVFFFPKRTFYSFFFLKRTFSSSFFFQSGLFARLFSPYGNLHVFDGLKVDLLLVVFSKTDFYSSFFLKRTFCSSFTFRKRTFCSSFFSKLTFCSSFSPYGNLHVFRGFKVDFLPVFFFFLKRNFCSFGSRSQNGLFC